MVIQTVYFSAYPTLKEQIDSGAIPWNKENVITLYDPVAEEANSTFQDFMADAFHCPKQSRCYCGR